MNCIGVHALLSTCNANIRSNRSSVGLAETMKALLKKYDLLFNISFPYSMGWHGKAFARKKSCLRSLLAHIIYHGANLIVL